MAYSPKPAGPRNLREFFHYLWHNLSEIGDNLGDEGGTLPPDPAPDPGHQHWHDNLINVLPDQHHNQVHALWGPDHSDVDYSDAIKSLEVIRYDGAQFIPDRRTKVHGGGIEPANNVSLPGDIWFNNGTGQPSTGGVV